MELELRGLALCRRCQRRDTRGCQLMREELRAMGGRLDRLALVAHAQLPPVVITVETPCRDSLSWS